MQMLDDSRVKALETRLSKFEKVMTATDTKITFQVGATKITITANEVTIEGTKFSVKTINDVTIQADNCLTLKASRNSELSAGSVLSLKGAIINEN